MVLPISCLPIITTFFSNRYGSSGIPQNSFPSIIPFPLKNKDSVIFPLLLFSKNSPSLASLNNFSLSRKKVCRQTHVQRHTHIIFNCRYDQPCASTRLASHQLSEANQPCASTSLASHRLSEANQLPAPIGHEQPSKPSGNHLALSPAASPYASWPRRCSRGSRRR